MCMFNLLIYAYLILPYRPVHGTEKSDNEQMSRQESIAKSERECSTLQILAF